MEQISNTKPLDVVQQESKEHRVEPESMYSNPKSFGNLLIADGAFISNLGWISILTMTISGLTMAGIGAGL
jgi:hypothetical protein